MPVNEPDLIWWRDEVVGDPLQRSPVTAGQRALARRPRHLGNVWRLRREESPEPLGTPLIPIAPTKPIRYWFEMGDQDLFFPNPTIPDGMHDWTLSAELVAKLLAAKGYHYQYVFARNARHVDRPTVAQTLPAALEWLWKGYTIP